MSTRRSSGSRSSPESRTNPWILHFDRSPTGPLEQGELTSTVTWGELAPGGPWGPAKEHLRFLAGDGSVLFEEERPLRSDHPHDEETLDRAARALRALGIHLRAAMFSGRMQVTGMSDGSGGWIGPRGYRDLDPIHAGICPDRTSAVRAELEELHARGVLRLAALPRPPQPTPGPLPADRVRGLLWGTAIGDSLGNTSESKLPGARRERYGEIRDYLPNRHAGGARVGLPSDDTQLTVWTAQSVLDAGRPTVPDLIRSWRRSRIFGIGSTWRAFLSQVDQLGPTWEASQDSAGNGALMRVAGAVLPHAWNLDQGMFDTVVYTSALSHNCATSTAACVAFAEILRRALHGGRRAFPPGSFVRTFVETARPLEGEAFLQSRVPGDGWRGPLWRFVQERLPRALEEGWTPVQAGERWHSGAYLLETVPLALLILERYAHDPEEAIVRAVNDTRDNDTIAAIVGGVVGAMHGAEALPERWRAGLLGRTTDSDDGELERFWVRLRSIGGWARDD